MKTDSGLGAYCHGNGDFMGAILANLHNPYIQRGHRPFVILSTSLVDLVFRKGGGSVYTAEHAHPYMCAAAS